jgi:hypothetical protein
MLKFSRAIPMMRLAAQQLSVHSIQGIEQLVKHMGALQAQDFPMSKWAIGCRLNDITQDDVNNAFANGTIVRTHVLRPTWHVVAATDLMWLLDLTSPNILTATLGYHKTVGITSKMLKASATVLEKSLMSGNDFSRDEISEILQRAKINTDEHRLSHFLMDAELNGMICSGCVDGNGQRYKLIPQNIKTATRPDRDEAIQRLAAIYFKSHGPATIHDFHWWSALSIADCKKGVSLNSGTLSSFDDDGTMYYFDEAACSFTETKKQHHLLPAFDEFFIGYKDRSASIPVASNSKLFTNNGIFWPSLITNGRAAGKWKRKINSRLVNIDIELFTSPSSISMRSLKAETERFGRFLGKKPQIKIGNGESEI